MDIWRLMAAAFRRWYVLLPLLAVSAAAALSAGASVAPEYTTTSAVQLLPPGIQQGPFNPYATNTAPQALQIVLSSSATRSEFAAAGLDPAYEVTSQPRSPILLFEVRSDGRQKAIDTGAELIRRLEAELGQQQEAVGVPELARVTVQILDAPDSVSEVTSGATRVKAMVAVVGVVLSFLMAIFFDDLVTLLRRLRSRSPTRENVMARTSEGEAQEVVALSKVRDDSAPSSAVEGWSSTTDAGFRSHRAQRRARQHGWSRPEWEGGHLQAAANDDVIPTGSAAARERSPHDE